MAGKSSKPAIFLRPDYNPAARKHIEEYLNAEYPDWERVAKDLTEIANNAEKIVISHYEGQHQVSAFFIGEEDGFNYGVSGLGETLDLAILSCYVKCHFCQNWKFGVKGVDELPDTKPRFS